VEKEQLATASAIFGNYEFIQSATSIVVTWKAEPIRQNTLVQQLKKYPIRLHSGIICPGFS